MTLINNTKEINWRNDFPHINSVDMISKEIIDPEKFLRCQKAKQPVQKKRILFEDL